MRLRDGVYYILDAMKEYFQRLKTHPGLGFACMLQILFLCAGLSNESLSAKQGALLGLAIGMIPWILVLWSNRK